MATATACAPGCKCRKKACFDARMAARDRAQTPQPRPPRKPPRTKPCVHFGDTLRDADGRAVEKKCGTCPGSPRHTVHACRKGHGDVTAADCGRCADYDDGSEPGALEEQPAGRFLPRTDSDNPCDAVSPDMSVAEMVAKIRSSPPGPWPHKKQASNPKVDDWPMCWSAWENTKAAFRQMAREYIPTIEAPPELPRERGVVIAGGGSRYLPSTYVAVRTLRHVGCTLPIQVWHLGPQEMDAHVAGILAEYGVECVDALALRPRHPCRILCGWELKIYATAYSPFREVLFLDADCAPTKNPEYLFDEAGYRERGATFYPDFDHHGIMGRMQPQLCADFGFPYRNERSFESGQYLVDKSRCWQELRLAMWYAEHSDFVFKHVYGDKECFHLAWRRLGTDWSMTGQGPGWEGGHTIIQHDEDRRRIFLHRCRDKWKLDGTNRRIDALELEAEKWGFVADLKARWNGKLWDNPNPTEPERQFAEQYARGRWLYRRLPEGKFKGDERRMTLAADGTIGEGGDRCERRWAVHATPDDFVLTISGEDAPTCQLKQIPCSGGPGSRGYYLGRWLDHERCPVELVPV